MDHGPRPVVQGLLRASEHQKEQPAGQTVNLLAIAARKGQFLCGGVLMPNLQDRYLGLRDRLIPVDYFPESQAKLPPEKRDRYEAVTVTEPLEGRVEARRSGSTTG